jgi:hypothetical protein
MRRNVMTLDEIKTICTRALLEGYGKRDLAAIDEIFSRELAEEVKRGSAYWHSVGPDLEYTVEQVIAEGDTGVVLWTCTQTQTGVFWGVAPTGKPGTGSGVSIFRVENGTVVEQGGCWDALGAMIQLGAIPLMIAEGYQAS